MPGHVAGPDPGAGAIPLSLAFSVSNPMDPTPMIFTFLFLMAGVLLAGFVLVALLNGGRDLLRRREARRDDVRVLADSRVDVDGDLRDS